jgi:branched-chain amino acid aminotransferase
MPAIANLDGTLLPPAEARVSIFDRGFLAGDQVYEVVRTYRLVPFELPAHLARLARSAERIGLALPWEPARLAREVARTVEASRGGDAEDPLAAPWNRGQRSVRVVVTRGAGEEALSLGVDPSPHVILAAVPLRAPPAAAYREGVRCILVQARVPRADPLAKTGGHLAEALAGLDARAAGAEEAIFVDDRGRVTEGASSNLFLVKGGRLATPPLRAGILAGVTRGLVLRLAAGAVPVEERELAPADLEAADELFLTSTSREVLPVTRLGSGSVGDGKVGPVATRLHRLYRAVAGGAGGDGAGQEEPG